MKVGIYTNSLKDSDYEVTNRLIDILKSHKVDFRLCENQRKFDNSQLRESFPNIDFLNENDYGKLDLMITVGGDGTVLSVAQNCILSDVPILPVNKGTKGFLNEIELDSLDRVMEVIKGDFQEDKRITISVAIKGEEHLALNEAYITRKNSGKMLRISSKANGCLVDKYFCDGLLVCTPTGSTAYSLSAGGPIISPNASAMCITPVNSHCLRSRPIVVGDYEEIEITLLGEYDDAVLVVDGIITNEIKAEDKLIIRKSNKYVRFFRLKESSFYLKLLDRLNGLI